MVTAKVSQKATQHVISPVLGGLLGFYYHPLIGFGIALLFGFQEAPIKFKNKILGCRINWQMFFIYFVIGLASQVINILTLLLGSLLGIFIRWYVSDKDLDIVNQYWSQLIERTEGLQEQIMEKTAWVFQFTREQKEKMGLDSFLVNQSSEYQQQSNEFKQSKEMNDSNDSNYQENPST